MGLDKLDLAIIALYLVGITLFGLRFRKRQRSLRDYFLAGRDIPWWAIALSIVAAETSTLTIISIPGLAYDTNLTFLQVVMGYVVGRVVISFVLLPHYFRGDLYTAYELIERRFGRGLALAHRRTVPVDADGGRRRPRLCRVDCGGHRAGDGRSRLDRHHHCIDAHLYVRRRPGRGDLDRRGADRDLRRRNAGRISGRFCILCPEDGARFTPQPRARANCKCSTSRPNFWIPYTFWAGVIGGAFLTTASHGTDQLIVQRLLAARSQKQSVTALLSSGVAILFQFALFLMVGIMLWAYYRVPSATFGKPDRIYPTFIVSRMPHGISGLLIAAILAAAMSNLSAALNSLSSSSIMDFYVRFRPQADERTQMRLSRLSTFVWALVLFGLAVLSLHKVGRVIEVGIADCVRGLWRAAGSFPARSSHAESQPARRDGGNVVRVQHRTVFVERTHVPWTWWVMIGTIVTFAVGYVASIATKNSKS